MPARKDFAPGEFCWVDLAAHDLESAAAWYVELFGWNFQMVESSGGPPYAFFMQDGAAVGGLAQMSDEMKALGVPPMWNSYIASEDCAATEAKVKEVGGTVTVPTMEIPGFGKLAFFLDPEGASFAAWQALSSDGPGMLVGEPVGVSWNELMTRDPAAASKFYGDLVGWQFQSMPMGEIDYTMIKNADKDAGGLMPMAGPKFEGIPAHWLVYFAVADCDATAAKVAETGGRVHVPPTDIPVGRFACFADPQGGAFAVVTVANAAG